MQLVESVRRNAQRPYMNLLTTSSAIGLFFAYTWVLLKISSDRSGFYQLYLLMLIQLTPALVTFCRKGFNYMVYIMMDHFIVYSVAKYNLLTNIERATSLSPETVHAVREMIYCSILIIFSYYCFRFILFGTSSERRQFNLLRIPTRLVVYLGIFLVAEPYFLYHTHASLWTLLEVVGFLGTALIFGSHCEDPTTERWVKAGVIAACFYAFLRDGSLSTAAGLGSVLLAYTLLRWNLASFALVAFIALSGILIQSVKFEYRIASKAADNMSVVERTALLSDLIVDKYIGDQTEKTPQAYEVVDQIEPEVDVRENLAKGFARVGDDSLERVLALTPSRIPFWNGETYAYIPYIFIPRVLWHDKPIRDIWHKFGKVYGFLGDDDHDTSVGINFLGEAYMNFGFTGLYLVSCIFGILVAFVEWLSFRFLDRATFFVFVCFMNPFMNYGLDLASIISGIVIVGGFMILIRPHLRKFLLTDSYA